MCWGEGGGGGGGKCYCVSCLIPKILSTADEDYIVTKATVDELKQLYYYDTSAAPAKLLL